jgi:hypothetical protein
MTGQLERMGDGRVALMVNLRKRDRLEDIDVDRNMIIKRIFKK